MAGSGTTTKWCFRHEGELEIIFPRGFEISKNFDGWQKKKLIKKKKLVEKKKSWSTKKKKVGREKKNWSTKKKKKNWLDKIFSDFEKYFRIWHFEKYFRIWDFEKYFKIWDFEKYFKILRFQILKKYFQIFHILKIFIFSVFFSQKYRFFTITSKLCFVINIHSIRTKLVCTNNYRIRRIVSTRLNIHIINIKEVRALYRSTRFIFNFIYIII